MLSAKDSLLRLLVRSLLLLLLACVLLVVFAYHQANKPLSMSASKVEFTIPPGSSLQVIAQRIKLAGIGVKPDVLIWLARATRKESKIKAGSYRVLHGINTWQLLGRLTEGDVIQEKIRLVEGLTLRQWRRRLNEHPRLRHDSVELDDAELAARLGSSEITLEGLLFPDTYLFDADSSDLDLLSRSYQQMRNKLDNAWRNRADNLPYDSAYEALIMASIIEKETGRSSDRNKIAAVFVNRLQIGMLLQADPTVIYGLGKSFDGNLRKRDLLNDTPYNTYIRHGLPPTPIAMVSEASLRAALHPADSDALYFVATGDGGSVFSRTLAEHNRAVDLYQRRRRH